MIRPPEQLETARLRLRLPVPADARAIFERWAQDPEVTRYLAWTPHRDLGESETHVVRCLHGWRTGEEYVWLIDELDTDRLVGSIAARDQVHGVNIGYLLARDAWGKGYMVEAVRAVTDWFLGQPEVHRVWATCDTENLASARVLERAGFDFEGVLRRWQPHPGASPAQPPADGAPRTASALAGPRDARCYSRVK